MDWDAALASLDSGFDGALDADVDIAAFAAPHAVDDEDPETVRFEELHGLLHVAVHAVLEATDNEIAYLE